MYQAFSMIVSIIALTIVSSSALFITGNNKNIDAIKNQTSKLNDDFIARNQLTKNQILKLIDNINENDANIISQHSNITNNMRQVEKESKIRTENLDSRFNAYKTAANHTIIGLTDTVTTNDRNVNKRVDTLATTVGNNYSNLDYRMNEATSDHIDLKGLHDGLYNEYISNKVSVSDALNSNVAHTNTQISGVMGFVNSEFSKFASEKIEMKDAAREVMNSIKSLTETRLSSLETNYKRGDNALRDKINENDSSYNTRFLKKSDLKDQVNAKFFANKPFTDFGDLIQQTKTNEDNVIKINSKLSVNDTIIDGIKKDYVKTDDLSTKINEMIPETSSYKSIKGFIDKNTSDITGLNEKVAKNIESIEESNKELKALMTDITGGLSGEISLKDLNDRIVKNAETIRTSAAQNNREMMREVRKETGRLDAEIKSNTENISKKLDNNKNEYVRAFNEYI